MEQNRKQNTGLRLRAGRCAKVFAVAMLLSLRTNGFAAVADLACSPPVPPSVPQDSVLLKEYADVIEHDFQAYFDALTDFSICHDQIFARVMQEAKEVSLDYRSFLERVDALGAEIAPRAAPDSQPDIQTPKTDHRGFR